MSILKSIKKGRDVQLEQGWEYIHWAIDVHNTIFPSTKDKTYSDIKFYPYAKETLHFLTNLNDQNLILWTSTNNEIVYNYLLPKLEEYDISFNYFNRNPICINNHYACFDKKFYYDIMIDDKAGFDPETEWKTIYNYINHWR